MTTLNNYDMSSTGVNLELAAFYDTLLAQSDFNQCFNIIQYSGHSQPSLLVFRDWGAFDFSDWRLTDYANWDLSNITIKEMVKVFIKHNVDMPLLTDCKDILKDLSSLGDVLPLRDADKEELFYSIRAYIGDESSFIEYLEKVATPTFAEIKTIGYSQGDVSYVYIPKQVIDSHDGYTVGTIGDLLQDVIHHLVWDAPVYAQLTINGDAYNLAECLHDGYNWSPSDILESDLLGMWLENYKPELNTVVMDFLKENLPTELEYK